MDAEEALPRPGDPLGLVMKQDLDPLSLAELQARILTLEGEIARCRQKIERVVNHKASAEALFKR